jgi:hypothetical protein
MSQEQSCTGQDINAICARIPTATTSLEMIAETLESLIIKLAD